MLWYNIRKKKSNMNHVLYKDSWEVIASVRMVMNEILKNETKKGIRNRRGRI